MFYFQNYSLGFNLIFWGLYQKFAKFCVGLYWSDLNPALHEAQLRNNTWHATT